MHEREPLGKERFNLNALGSPRKQRRKFLTSNAVMSQKFPAELEREWNSLLNPNMPVEIGSHFWLLLCKKFPKLIVQSVFARLASSIAIICGIFLSEGILDEVSSKGIIATYCAMFFVTQIFSTLAQGWGRLQQENLRTAVEVFILNNLHFRILDRGLERDSEEAVGRIKTLLTADVRIIGIFVNNLVQNAVPVIPSALIFSPIIISRLGLSGFVSVITSFLCLPLAYITSEAISRYQSRVQNHEDKFVSALGEWLKNIRFYRLSGMQEFAFRRIYDYRKKLISISNMQHVWVIANFGISMFWWMVPVLVLCYSLKMADKDVSLPVVFGCIWLLNEIQSSMKLLPFSFTHYGSAKASLERLQEFWRSPDLDSCLLPFVERKFLDSATPVAIVMKNVTLGYGNREVLADVSLRLDLNKRHCIIGPTGSGKSLLLRCLFGEALPKSGRIDVEFDNGMAYDLKHKNVYHKLRTFVALVEHESFLTANSLVKNLTFNSDALDQKTFADTLNIVQLSHDIERLDQGIHTLVGENGAKLSGGQRQRLALARAIYSGRPILALDDPLTGLDNRTAGYISDYLANRSKPYIMCSHVYNTRFQADCIWTITPGGIVLSKSEGYAGESRRCMSPKDIQ